MLKYVDTLVTFREVPGEISLAIDISNCPHRCRNCHSAYLQTDIGEELTDTALRVLIDSNPGITCVAFLGGDNDVDSLRDLAKFVRKEYPNLKLCWYTGYNEKIFKKSIVVNFDFVKTGPYIESRGPLTNPNTNQAFYHQISDDFWVNETYKFQNNGN